MNEHPVCVSLEVRVVMDRDDVGRIVMSDPIVAGTMERDAVLDLDTLDVRDATDEEADTAELLLDRVIEAGIHTLKNDPRWQSAIDDDDPIFLNTQDHSADKEILEDVLLYLLRLYIGKKRDGAAGGEERRTGPCSAMNDPGAGCACPACLRKMWNDSEDEGN